jgi:hypothetical protein
VRVADACPEQCPDDDRRGNRACHREQGCEQHVPVAAVAELVDEDEPHLCRLGLFEQGVGDASRTGTPACLASLCSCARQRLVLQR